MITPGDGRIPKNCSNNRETQQLKEFTFFFGIWDILQVSGIQKGHRQVVKRNLLQT
jgi:hypothetical protein